MIPTPAPAPTLDTTCPDWCAVHHGVLGGEEDLVHVSAVLRVAGTPVRLCVTADPSSSELDGPYVLIGPDEYTLHEADALIGALTQLVDAADGLTRLGGA